MSDLKIQELRRKVADGDPDAKEQLKRELIRTGAVDEAWRVIEETGHWIGRFDKRYPIWTMRVGANTVAESSNPDTGELEIWYRNNRDKRVDILVLEDPSEVRKFSREELLGEPFISSRKLFTDSVRESDDPSPQAPI